MSQGLPLTYRDLVCLQDLDPFAKETQSDLETLSQDVLHILLEVLGSNLDDQDRGLGVVTLLSGTQTNLAAVSSDAATQLTKDPRIDSATVNITQTNTEAFTLQITISVAGSVLGLSYAYTAAGGLLYTGAQWP